MRGVLVAALLIAAVCGAAYAETASWYHEGQRVACGDARFRPDGLTAAHRRLPCGTRVRVSAGGRTVIVRINDRGPAAWTHRDIDLSRGAARALHRLAAGVFPVKLEILR
jgi:rare lipoprotein A